MTQRIARASSLLLMLLMLTAGIAVAQPGGPGGRPPMGGGPGGRPGGRPPMGNRDWNQMGDNEKANQVKQKKKVREGDKFKVVGSLRDSVSGEFLPFVNVAILDSVDSSFVKGGSTNLDGLFEIADVPQGAYLLRVSAIGYASVMLPFTVNNNTALGTLRLRPGATSLKEVTISAERPLYAMDGEKMVYNVSEDPSIQTGTTEDALQNAPGVEVDVEGNITLRGVSSVEIWINDKPSKLTEENLKTYLQTLPANALARIETITNPSAKYATSAEAVINIITSAHIKSNQFVSFGVNGSNQPFVSPWVSYMWAKEKWSVNLFASGRYSSRDNTSEGWSMRRSRIGGTDEDPEFDTTLYQTDASASQNRSLSGNFFLNVNYEIDSMSEISANAGGMINGQWSESRRATMQYFNANDSLLNYVIGDTSTSPSGFGHVGADYTKKFDLEGHNLRIGFNANYSRNGGEEYYDRVYAIRTDLDEHRYLINSSQSNGIDIDARYNRPYSKDGEMSYGLRANWQNEHDEYNRYNDHDGTAVDDIRSYSHQASEVSADADVNWTHRWGGLTLSSGLGAGLQSTDYRYETVQWFADDTNFMHFTVRPSVHLTYRTESMHNLKINYSMRMANPTESQLTTFRRYGEDSYSTGNRDLKASYTHNVEAGWQKFFESFGNVGIEAYGRLSTNEISSLTDAEQDDLLDRIVSYSTPYNMGSSWRYGTSLNMTYRPSGFFNVRLYANVYNYGYRMAYDREENNVLTHVIDERDKWSYSVRVNAWAKIYGQYQLHLSANYNSPTLSLMSERKARYSLNMGVRSDFFKRKLSVFINIQDIFNWGGRYGSGSDNYNPYFLGSTTSKMLNSRYISAGVTFRFGKMELEQNAREGSSETGDTL